jgi:hypothetical protein
LSIKIVAPVTRSGGLNARHHSAIDLARDGSQNTIPTAAREPFEALKRWRARD